MGLHESFGSGWSSESIGWPTRETMLMTMVTITMVLVIILYIPVAQAAIDARKLRNATEGMSDDGSGRPGFGQAYRVQSDPSKGVIDAGADIRFLGQRSDGAGGDRISVDGFKAKLKNGKSGFLGYPEPPVHYPYGYAAVADVNQAAMYGPQGGPSGEGGVRGRQVAAGAREGLSGYAYGADRAAGSHPTAVKVNDQALLARSMGL